MALKAPSAIKKFRQDLMASPNDLNYEPIGTTQGNLRPSTPHFSNESSSDEDITKPTEVHHWSIEERVTLALLADKYDLTWNDRTRIFNRCHRKSIARSKGLAERVLRTQWNWMKPWFNGATAWNELNSASPAYGSDKSKTVTRALLEKQARGLGIELVEKVQTNTAKDLEPSKPPKARKRKLATFHLGKDRSNEGFSFPSSDGENQTPPSTSKRRRIDVEPKTPQDGNNAVASRGLLTPPASTKGRKQQFEPNQLKRLPRIAFRAFSKNGSQGINSVDGFRAGAFIDSPTIPPPLNPDDPYYRDEVIRHVAPVHSGPTSLISVTRNLVRALFRALKIGPDSFLAVIDLHEADREDLVQSAAALRLKVSHRYRPQGEFLVWGAIDPSAIISVVGLPELLAAMPAMPSDNDPFRLEIMRANEFLMPVRQSFRDDPLPMSYHAGEAVGKLLHALSIPAKADLCEAAVYSFITDWKFEGRCSNWQTNGSFRNGVERAYRSKQSESETPLNFEEVAKIATDLMEERATEKEHELNHDTTEDQPAEDIQGYPDGQSMRLDTDWLAETAAAIKDEYDSLGNDTHRDAGPDCIPEEERDAAEEDEVELDTTVDHTSEGQPSLTDDDAFTKGFVGELLDFVNAQDPEGDVSKQQPFDILHTDGNEHDPGIKMRGYDIQMPLHDGPPGKLPPSRGFIGADSVVQDGYELVDALPRAQPGYSHPNKAFNGPYSWPIEGRGSLDTSQVGLPGELLPNGNFNGPDSWTPGTHCTIDALPTKSVPNQGFHKQGGWEHRGHDGGSQVNNKKDNEELYQHAWTGM